MITHIITEFFPINYLDTSVALPEEAEILGVKFTCERGNGYDVYGHLVTYQCSNLTEEEKTKIIDRKEKYLRGIYFED